MNSRASSGWCNVPALVSCSTLHAPCIIIDVWHQSTGPAKDPRRSHAHLFHLFEHDGGVEVSTNEVLPEHEPPRIGQLTHRTMHRNECSENRHMGSGTGILITEGRAGCPMQKQATSCLKSTCSQLNRWAIVMVVPNKFRKHCSNASQIPIQTSVPESTVPMRTVPPTMAPVPPLVPPPEAVGGGGTRGGTGTQAACRVVELRKLLTQADEDSRR
jgi:hypothetical protein